MTTRALVVVDKSELLVGLTEVLGIVSPILKSSKNEGFLHLLENNNSSISNKHRIVLLIILAH